MSNNVSDEKNGVPFEEIQKQFFQCVRGPNETFDEFLAKLHALAELGRFGEKTNTVILNKIKTEMADVDLKQKLESITDYDKAVDKCREAEEWRNASMDPYIVRLRQEIKSHGISKVFALLLHLLQHINSYISHSSRRKKILLISSK